MAHTLVAANGSVPELLKVLASAHLVGQKVAVSVDGEAFWSLATEPTRGPTTDLLRTSESAVTNR